MLATTFNKALSMFHFLFENNMNNNFENMASMKNICSKVLHLRYVLKNSFLSVLIYCMSYLMNL